MELNGNPLPPAVLAMAPDPLLEQAPNAPPTDPVLAHLVALTGALTNRGNSNQLQTSNATYQRIQANCTPYSGEFSEGNTFQEFFDIFMIYAESANPGGEVDKEVLKVILPSYLRGTALLYYQSLPTSTKSNFDDLVIALQKRFDGDTQRAAAMSKLMQRVQLPGEPVDVFCTALRMMAARCFPDLKMDQRDQMLMPLFINALLPSIRQVILERVPGANLEECVNQARSIYDSIKQRKKLEEANPRNAQLARPFASQVRPFVSQTSMSKPFYPQQFNMRTTWERPALRYPQSNGNNMNQAQPTPARQYEVFRPTPAEIAAQQAAQIPNPHAIRAQTISERQPLKIKCFLCGGEHFKRDCPNLRTPSTSALNANTPSPSAGPAAQQYNMIQEEAIEDNSWNQLAQQHHEAIAHVEQLQAHILEMNDYMVARFGDMQMLDPDEYD
jgi:hypothetical protein